MLSQHAAAWTALSAAHEVAVRQALPRATVVSMSNLAFCCVDEALSLHPEQDAVRRAELGARALPIATEALALAQQHELTVLGGFAAISLGFGHLLCGDLPQAHAVLLQAKHWTAEHSTTQVDALFGLAMVSRLLHKTEEAKALLARAEGMAQARGLTPAQANACLASKQMHKTILAMTKDAVDVRKINATPTFLINGQPGPRTSEWADVDAALKSALGQR
jgi:hypothetical protein